MREVTPEKPQLKDTLKISAEMVITGAEVHDVKMRK